MTASGQTGHLYRYEDILRAIGRYIDANQLQDVILLQSDEGILLRGFRRPRGGAHGHTLVQHLFTPEELAAIDEAARKRRGAGSRLFR
ncbi:MAG: hypothetical protein IRY97_02815 [Thermomicrobiaceae bacterium]|nr:hypothetical protein [Thermomicrobiaceae bacterium]